MREAKLIPFLKEIGLDPREAKQIRETRLTSEDWFVKKGRGRPSYWLTEEGQAKLRLFAEVKDTDPQIAPYFTEVYIHRLTPNPAQVQIRIPDETADCKFRLARCVIPLSLQNWVRPGIPIKVECIPDRNGISYRHEIIARYDEGRSR